MPNVLVNTPAESDMSVDGLGVDLSEDDHKVTSLMIHFEQRLHV
jgi:hypothetical protein